MAGAGHKFKPTDVSWYKRDALLFANSIGCTVDELHFLYELHPEFQVFPTYPILLPFKHTDQEVIDFYARTGGGLANIPGIPKLDTRRMVDGQRQMYFYKPIPTSSEGRKFEVQGKVLGAYDKGKPGTVMEQESILVDKESGEQYARIVSQGFYVGQGGWGGPKGDKASSYDPPKDKKPDASVEFQTNRESALLYRLSGDYNPLHADPEPGKKMGFGGTIMHGLFSWNTSAHAVLKEMGGSKAENLKEFQARFAAPVKPGDKLIIDMWKMGKVEGGLEEVRFITRVEGGKTVLSNGRALVKLAPKSKL